MSGTELNINGPRTLAAVLLGALALLALAAPRPADAAISLESFTGSVLDASGNPYTQAGGHPHEVMTEFRIDTLPDGKPVEDAKDIRVSLPPGFMGIPPAVPFCSADRSTQFFLVGNPRAPLCDPETQVGYAEVEIAGGNFGVQYPIYNLEPPPGIPARFGFTVLTPDIALDGYVRPDDYGVDIISRATSQGLSLNWVKVVMWGVPADDAHKPFRGCPFGPELYGCESAAEEKPFLTLPTDCSAGPLTTTISVNSWQHPDQYATASFNTDVHHGNAPMEVENCDPLTMDPSIEIQPTMPSAESGAGLRVDLAMPQNVNPDGYDTAHLKKTVVRLPEGVTVNPSAAEGLGVCTPGQYAQEAIDAAQHEGCPSTSRIGSVEIETPALNRTLTGSLYQAQQDDPTTGTPGAENPFDSLLGLYVVAKSSERGVAVKLAGKVEPDPRTGQLITTFDDLPQTPFSRFSLKFREGARAVLVTPPACGTYTSVAEFVPWSASDPRNPRASEVIKRTSDFTVTSGVGGGPCPQGAAPPFNPGFSAGTINNNGKSFSPFTLRMTRADGEQNMTRFSSVLPRGVLAKLAGVAKCPDSAIAVAKGKTGREELANPSCPANSQIGRILAGAGVGSVLTYVPGKVYLGGPVGGAPLSVIVITPAVAGPFDVGTVVVREALDLDPVTAEVKVDGAISDPIPHILAGIPLKLRDLRVYIDRDQFTLNPTNCKPLSVGATLFGSGADVFNSGDDGPAALSSRFQAANCASLGFKPRLKINLKGGTKRGQYPALRAVVNARPGDANIGKAVVTLPHSGFLEQAHIRTICTRVQYAANNCPKAAIYGHARAVTPLLDQPLEGPVYLRSSSNKLPDLVASLRGEVDIDLVGRIDSVNARIRTTFDSVPDAPVSRFVLRMQGGKKGLLVNSKNICTSVNRAAMRMIGQNGASLRANPVVRSSGCKGKPRKAKSKQGSAKKR